MDFKAELVKRVTKDLHDVMKYRNKTLKEAIEIVKEESCAGHEVWDEVLKNGISIG